ncbi:MAG: FKBP-type peptidyl-prolyl cis-trans isomerase [Bacteroidetes bacterium]|nr:FKBP-type peptidyl-prolyl cis-trans isomerase [Bacteroidota bacterium]
MKRTQFILILFSALLIIPFTSNAQFRKKNKSDKKEVSGKPVLVTKTDTISYIIGADIAHSFKSNEIEINYDIFNQGLTDGLKGCDSVFKPEQIQQIMMAWNQEMMKTKQEKTKQECTSNRQKGAEFLAENKKKEGVIELPSGLQYKIIKEGTGVSPVDTSMVEVDYTGKLIDGTVFDSSKDRGEPIEFAVNGVIPGWTEGLKLMKPGATYMFYIPADLGYGDKKMGKIPAGSTLIFEVDLLVVDNK